MGFKGLFTTSFLLFNLLTHSIFASDSSVLNDEMVDTTAELMNRNELNTINPDEQSIGFYADGSLVNAASLNDQGLGFIKMFQKRNRNYGATDLVELLSIAARTFAEAYPYGERLQIGDMSQQNGGKIGHHDSHQNGLDVDLIYFRKNKTEQSPDFEAGFEESFVIKKKLSPNFDVNRNFRFIKLLVSSGRINRIFIDPVIKKTFCNYTKRTNEFKESIEVLRVLRPYPNHDDHMHVRLVCPEKSTRCIAQPAPPKGSGCNQI